MATIRIESTTVMVREDEGVAMVCVTVQDAEYDCPIVFPFEVNFVTSDGNASKYTTIFHYSLSEPSFFPAYLRRSPEYSPDYVRQHRTRLNFRECHHRECHPITILEDSRLEDTENFFVIIEKGHGVIPRMTFTDIRAEIIIEDVSGMYGSVMDIVYILS